MSKRLYALVFLVIIAVVFAVAQDQPAKPIAPAPEVTSFTFAVFGDNRPGTPDGAQPEAYRTVLKKIDSFEPAFAVSTGDSIYGSWNPLKMQEQYEKYVQVTKANLRAKVYLALGNHEIAGNPVNQAFFQKELPGLYYSFDHGNAHFIVLDSYIVGQANKVTGDQLEWLKEDLQKSRAIRHRFVFLHSPLYPVDGHMGQCLDKYPKDRDALHALFVKSRITAVFVGHEHLFHQQMKNGVRYVITGGGGAPLYPSYDGKGDFHHFVLVNVSGDKVEMKVVKPAFGKSPEEILPLEKAGE